MSYKFIDEDLARITQVQFSSIFANKIYCHQYNETSVWSL